MTGDDREVIEWRPACAKCGRFVSNSVRGTVYTPYGPNLEYDGYTDLCRCSRCGLQEVRDIPVRWGHLVSKGGTDCPNPYRTDGQS